MAIRETLLVSRPACHVALYPYRFTGCCHCVEFEALYGHGADRKIDGLIRLVRAFVHYRVYHLPGRTDLSGHIFERVGRFPYYERP